MKKLAMLTAAIVFGAAPFGAAEEKNWDGVISDAPCHGKHSFPQLAVEKQGGVEIVEEMLRVGRNCIVTFPNFAYWRYRFYLMTQGRMPVSKHLPYAWYDTPNIHFCTIRDFVELLNDVDAKIERGIALDRWGRPVRLNAPWEFWNFFGEQGLFLLTRKT